MLLDDGKTERVVLANKTSLEAFQEAITEYRVLGPTINGCSWIELCPRTSRKHQVLQALSLFYEQAHSNLCMKILGKAILLIHRFLVWFCFGL